MHRTRAWRWWAVALFVAVLGVLACTVGIHTDKEALKYIGCAEQLLQGDVHDLFGNYAKYGSYILFITPFIVVGLPLFAVVAQLVLAVFAAQALGRIAQRITGSTLAADIAFVFALFCFPLQQWVLALYTESFFASVSVIFLERITRPGRADTLTWVLALIVLFARPVGLLFVGPAAIWKLVDTGSIHVPMWLRNTGYGMILLVAICIPGIARDQMAPIVEAHVICGFPERPGAMQDFEGSTVLEAQCHLYAHNGLGYTLGLFVRRVVSLFTLPRDYFSGILNAFLTGHYALFLLAAWGWWFWRKHLVVGLLCAIFLLNVLLVGLTHDEWSERFLVPMWPIVLLFAAFGTALIHEKKLAA